ncbi:2-C-methyl-D-erythritol 2,4-cyclodiphosphate synthase [bacterium]|nr:2-C-methyl-D-erythritol 2,4-cyclodiphosphate synthase [candidate division CSSED10-310 bacterium]
MRRAASDPGTVMKYAGILLAAGGAVRFGSALPKQFTSLAGEPMYLRSIRLLMAEPAIDPIIVVVPEAWRKRVESQLSDGGEGRGRLIVTSGGATRQESCRLGLAALPGKVDRVVVHDAARPLTGADILARCMAVAAAHRHCIAAVRVSSALHFVNDQGVIVAGGDRAMSWEAQTPQVFEHTALAAAHEWARDRAVVFDDDAGMMAAFGESILVTAGRTDNIKVTTGGDLTVAAAVVAWHGRGGEVRVGIGFDVHGCAPARPLFLGGVLIPEGPGLEGHSDADVLLHALCDAMLGAAALGDLGSHFPDHDARWRDVAGRELVRCTRCLLASRGLAVRQLDAVVAAEMPRLDRHRDAMRQAMAEMLEIALDRVSVKATTTEGLGCIGRKEGIAAWVNVVVEER